MFILSQASQVCNLNNLKAHQPLAAVMEAYFKLPMDWCIADVRGTFHKF